MFLEFVHYTRSAIQWIEKIGKQWTHAMIYNRRTREKVDRITNNI